MSSHHTSTPSGKPRARGFRIGFDGTAGRLNAITDVPGVAVGYTTLISGDGPLVVGQGPVRTGVTAILPRPVADLAIPVFAGIVSFNGNGEMSGSHLVEEIGSFNLPVTITNTHSCGLTRDATLKWMHKRSGALDDAWGLPVAAETYDGLLNDINGHHVTDAHVFAALDGAAAGPIDEGSVGGGTGMNSFGFKAGSGTASRLIEWQAHSYTIGVFVQSNFGDRPYFTLRGIPTGRQLTEPSVLDNTPRREKSSIIGVLATDAPLLPHQMKRLARRMMLGVGLTGGVGTHGSGDIFLAFTTANPAAAQAAPGQLAQVHFLPDRDLNPFFRAAVQATEEAILNSLVANEDMTGRDGNCVPALPKAWMAEQFAQAGAPGSDGTVLGE